MLKQRAPDLGTPIQMCDALSRNVPKLSEGVEILVANCLAHGRRQFVEVAQSFPQECRYVLEALGRVYYHDAQVREQGLSAQERLRFHQQHSAPVMEELHGWLQAQLAQKKTEPNSALGKAITYLLRHWRGLTVFLRQAGAPLDNNLCEQVLKRAVLHRKNALFYRTLNGAEVGDLFMSLIHTCQLNGANSFQYLTELQRHGPATGGQSFGVDAVELPRDAGAEPLTYDDSRLTIKVFGEGGSFTRKWPQSTAAFRAYLRAPYSGSKAMEEDLRKTRFGKTGSTTKPSSTRTDPKNGRWDGITTWKTSRGFPLRPDASLPGSFHRSAKVRPSTSFAWHPKMPAPPICSC